MLGFLMLVAAIGVSAIPVKDRLSVTNGNSFGNWGIAEFCAEGTYAVGYDMKIEKQQSGGDDTALNGIKLICKSRNGYTDRRSSATSKVGPWGNWVGETNCDSRGGTHNFLTSFSLQVEPWVGIQKDDTSANFVKFKCRDQNATLPSYEMSKSPGSGPWGTYGSWSSECPTGQVICGIKTRVEGVQWFGDDTALNDVVFICCH